MMYHAEHKYAVLERQPSMQRQPLPQGEEVHHYDTPPREGYDSSHLVSGEQ